MYMDLKANCNSDRKSDDNRDKTSLQTDSNVF